jgi:hypothetical protein
VLEIPGKHRLSANEFLHVHHTFYLGYAVFGAIAWVYGVVVGLMAGYILRKINRRAARLSFLGALGFVFSLVIFFIFLKQYNGLIAGWASDPPAIWTSVRNRWEMSHCIVCVRLVFFYLFSAGSAFIKKWITTRYEKLRKSAFIFSSCQKIIDKIFHGHGHEETGFIIIVMDVKDRGLFTTPHSGAKPAHGQEWLYWNTTRKDA